MSYETLTLERPRPTTASELRKYLLVLPINIILYTFGIMGLFTIIFIPGSILAFKTAKTMWNGGTVLYECPACAKTNFVGIGKDSEPCPHCKTNIVFKWEYPA